MDVPIAVTSYTGEMLEAAGVSGMLDLNLASPSFFGNTLSNPLGNSPVRIRGIGTGGANPGPADPLGYEIATTQDADSVLEQWGAVAHLDFELNDNWALRSVTGYREIDNDNLNGDWGFGSLGLAGRLDQVFRFETLSQEFLLNGSFDFDDGRSLEVVAGLHYFSEDIQYNRIATVGPQFQNLLAFSIFGGVAPLGGGFADGPLLGLPACNGGVPNPTAFCFSLSQVGNTAYEFQKVLWDQEEESTGLFVHGTYDLNDQWSLIAGVRWNRVEKDITADNQAALTSEQYFDDVFNNALGFYFADAALASPDWDGSVANEEFTYLATLQFRPTDDTQLYLSYSRGFKAGGFNMTENAAAGEPSLPTARGVDPDGDGRTFAPFAPEGVDFAPEFVDAYELGFRWEYLDAGRLGVTVFRSEYDDLQVSQFTGLVFQVINAGSSTSQGVVIENFYQFSRNFGLNLGLTYLEAEYGSDVVGLPAGRDRGLSPELSAVVGLRYNQQVGNNAELFGNLNYSYYTEMFLAEGVGFPLQGEKQDNYSVLGAELGVHLGPVSTIWVSPVASQAAPIKARGARFGQRQMSDEQRRVARPGAQPEGPGPFFPRTALSPTHVTPATPRPLRLARRKNGSRQGQPR